MRNTHGLIRQLILIPILLIFLSNVQAQISSVTLSGKIQDAEKNTLPFVNVVLKTEQDSSFVAGVLTNEEGIFTFPALKKGTYLLEANYLGYETYRQRVLVGELSAFLDLGTLSITEQPHSLDEVVVTSKAEEVSGQMDKKTFTVADNICQSGGSCRRCRRCLV